MNYKGKTKQELIKELQESQQENNFLKSSLEIANKEVSRLSDKVFDFRWMLEHAGDAAIYRGNYQTMQYEYWSPNVEQVLGYTDSELFALGQPGVVKFINQDDYVNVGILLNELITNGGGPYSIDYRITAKDGKVRYINETGHAFVDENNIPSYAIGSIRDISIRKRAELLIHEKNDAIEAQNKELFQTNEELKIAKEKAEESDRLKTSFLQNMSHEIRTPMNAIVGFSDLLVSNFDNKDELQEFSKIIGQSCNDLLVIIDSILDIAKIESGQLPVNYEDCDLKELFTELSTFFIEYQNRNGLQHIKFSMHAFNESSNNIIFTDKVKLKQIFINLISNAFKFTNTGSIIGGGVFDENNKLVFYVSDTGIGIPFDKQQTIYDRFTQLQNGLEMNTRGTGIGLTIVKGLVGLLGGEIFLESEPEKGSKFSFSFPVKTVQML